MTVIGLGGAARAGKGEFAEVLEREYGFTVFSFSATLLDAIEAFGRRVTVPAGRRIITRDGSEVVASYGPLCLRKILHLASYLEAKRIPEVRRPLQSLDADVVRRIVDEDACVNVMRNRVLKQYRATPRHGMALALRSRVSASRTSSNLSRNSAAKRPTFIGALFSRTLLTVLVNLACIQANSSTLFATKGRSRTLRTRREPSCLTWVFRELMAKMFDSSGTLNPPIHSNKLSNTSLEKEISMTTLVFDVTLLTKLETVNIAYAIQGLNALDRQLDAVLLGTIPILNDGGNELIGYLHQGDDLQWRFHPPSYSPPAPPSPRTSHPDHQEPEFDDAA